jgi:hypothetical protein
MNIRKEKEKEFLTEHLGTLKKAKVADPFFTIKTAFFKKGKYGRQVQFFEWELEKANDIYIEFYDNVYDDSRTLTDVIPMYEKRCLFKHKHNPFYKEEYELKESTNSQGNPYSSYVISVSELTAILPNGKEVTYNEWEKIQEEPEPKEQNTLSIFPDFEEKKEEDDPKYVPWKESSGEKTEEVSKDSQEPLLIVLERIAEALEGIKHEILRK